MTREEAIKILRTRIVPIKNWQETHEAITMAIDALQTELVRCCECKHYSVEGETTQFGWCGYWNKPTDEMRYCSDGERREL